MFTLQKEKSFLIPLKLQWANLMQTPPLIPPSEIFAIMSVDPFQVERLFTMRVVLNGHPSNVNLHFVSCDLEANSKMTSLFRPWAEDNANQSSAEGVTNLYPEQTDSKTSSDLLTRESRYKSVKEHIKKRSEKHLLKKLKSQPKKSSEERKTEIVRFWDSSSTDMSAMASSFPGCCTPSEGYLPHLDCLLPRAGVPGIGLPGAEFLDIVSSQGFSTNIFEEYAKFLTEQQKMISERSRKQRPKKFRCPHCHVGFSNNGQLKGHIRIHTGERPFKCDAESCGKSFTRNEELTRHRRIHSGLRPFPCSECGKRFGRKDHLKKHVKTHYQQRYQLVPILPSHCPYFYGL